MDINKFTVPGYARFYRSLLRSYQEINSADALKLTYLLYAGVIESYRFKKTGVPVKELSEAEFCERIRHTEAEPYRTEIQFYRAMEAVAAAIDVSKAKIDYVKAFLGMTVAMSNSELRFYKAFNMEIDDERTVYKLCARSVVPRSDEPGLCLMRDWIDVSSASA